jgi:serine-type D-Ala-D-Ala carboxypeptidase (penicillin-binding protein 5/6)
MLLSAPLFSLLLVACQSAPPAPAYSSTQFAAPYGYSGVNYAQPGYTQGQTPVAYPVTQPQAGYAYTNPAQSAAPSAPTASYAYEQSGVDAPAVFAATSAPSIRASSYLLIDARTGRPLVGRSADVVRSVASTQKLLTALVVLDAGSLDKKVTVQSTDTQVEPTKLGLRAGETYTRRTLLYAFLIKSANDIGKVLARDVAGSQGAFAERMNAKARALGMRASYFVNPHGLTAPGQRSTARDMARVAMAAYRSDFIRDAVKRKYYSFRFANGKTITLKNTNDLLGVMPECNGMKTGYTNAAGRCLISSATSGSKHVILIQLGTKTKYIWDDARSLMSWGLRNMR